MDLFRSHVSYRTCHLLYATIARTLANQGNAKVTEQYFVTPSNQDVLWFYVPMHKSFIMSVLQGCCNLVNIVHNSSQGDRQSFRMMLAQTAVWRKVHH